MSRQIRSLNRSLSYPLNLQRTLQTYQSLTSPPLPCCHSLIIQQAWIMIMNPQTQFFIPSHNLKIPILKFQMNSRFLSPVRPLFRKTPSVHSTAQLPMNLPQPLLLIPNNPDPLSNDNWPTRPSLELENELDSFITLQQQLQKANTLTIHHLSQSNSSSESSNPASTMKITQAHRVFKRKHPNTETLHHPRPTLKFLLHPLHAKTKEFYKTAYHSFHNNLLSDH